VPPDRMHTDIHSTTHKVFTGNPECETVYKVWTWHFSKSQMSKIRPGHGKLQNTAKKNNNSYPIGVSFDVLYHSRVTIVHNGFLYIL
jgi:hypothetical protein